MLNIEEPQTLQLPDAETLALQDAKNRVTALTPDASFIIEAPAGAGKTELLTQRYLKLLATVNAPEEIIALTFTKKAAAEMAHRILTSLQAAQSNTVVEKAHQQVTRDLANAVLARSAQMDWQLLAQPSRLRILTMDALCSSLARQMPLLSAFGGAPNVAEDARAYYIEAAHRAIAQVEKEENLEAPISLALQLFDNNSQKLALLLADMLAKRDQWQEYTANLTRFDRHYVDDVANKAIKTLVEEKLSAAFVLCSPVVQQALMPIVRYATSHLDSHHPLSALLDWQTVLQPTAQDAPKWQALVELMLTKEGGYRKALNVNLGFPATKESKPFKEAFGVLVETLENSAPLADIRQLPNADDINANQRYIHALTELLMHANAHLWTIFQTAGEVDFISIAERAQLALGFDDNVTDLALALDYQIQHLLVDEFQDTSPMQLQLITKLTAGWQIDDGRTLFCVGDPMQSIYRFRKADVSIFLEVSQYGVGHLPLTKLTLSRNNRSQPAVIDWINDTFTHVFPSADHIDHGAIQYRPFIATKTSVENEGVTMHALVLNHISQDENSQEESQSEAALTEQDEASFTDEGPAEHNALQIEAQHVATLIANAKTQNAKQSIAVLVRSRQHLSHLVTHMKRDYPQILFQAVEIEALQNRQTIQDALSLTRALHHLADRVHWLNILRAPWCGLSLNDLYRIAGLNHQATIWDLMLKAHNAKSLSPDGQLRLAHVITILQNAFAHQGKMPVRRWLESTWLQLGGAKCLIAAGDIRDVNTFFNLVEKASDANYVDFVTLEAGMARLFAEPNLMADETVQFLTIHRSKGLEFDVVIVPGMNRQTRADDQPLVLWQEVKAAQHTYLLAAVKQKKAPIYSLLKALEKTRSDYEALRLLYVAATRAVKELHLVATIQQTKEGALKPVANGFLSILWPVVSTIFLSATPIKAEVRQGTIFADFVPKLQRLPLCELAILPMLEAGLAKELFNAHRYDNLQADSIAIDTLFTLDINRHKGVLAHRYMELIANSMHNASQIWSAARLASCLPIMQAWLMQQGHLADIASDAAQEVLSALETTLNSTAGQWVLNAHEAAQSELNLTQHTLSFNADVTQGAEPNLAENIALSQQALSQTRTHIIDRTFIADGTRWIIDYKLAHMSPHDNPLQMAQTHAPQLKRYAQLFTQNGLPIKTAVLFLTTGQLVEVSL